MSNNDVEYHSIAQSVILHLLPGILRGCFYFVIAQWIVAKGYPSGIALILSGIVVSYPFILGFLLYQGRKSSSLKGIIHYREKLPVKQYLIWVPVVFLAFGMIMTILGPVSQFLETQFAWLPEALHINMGLAQKYTGEYSISVLIVTCLLGFIFTVFIGPILEELSLSFTFSTL